MQEPDFQKGKDTPAPGKTKEGASLFDWLIYIKSHKKTAMISFIIFFLAGIIYTFFSPKYYSAATDFFYPLTSPGESFLNSLGLPELTGSTGDMPTYAVAILSGTTVSNHVIDKYGRQLFGQDIKKPRVELVKDLRWIVQIRLVDMKIVEISVETTDPKLSAEIANFYVDEYRRFAADSNSVITTDTRKNLESERNKIKKELFSLENRLLAFQNKKKVVDPPAELESMLKYYSDIKAMAAVSGVTVSQQEGKLGALRDKMAQQAEKSLVNPDLSQLLGNSAISSIYQQLMVKEIDLARKMQSRTQDNSEILILQDEISAMKGALQSRIKSHLKSIKSDLSPVLMDTYSETLAQDARKKALQKIVDEMDERFSKIPELTYSYRRLYRDILIKEKMLGYLEIEIEKAKAKEYLNPDQIQVIDKAVPPDQYSRPILRWYLLGAFILATLLTLLAVKIEHTVDNLKRYFRENRKKI